MAGQSPPLNVVLICLDDAVAFWKYKSAFGAALETPNLDRICGQSTSFHAAYCQAPVCSPSRASFMTGLSPHQTGVTRTNINLFETNQPTLAWPHALKTAGYHCSTGGKMIQKFGPLPQDIQATLYSDAGKHFRLGRRNRKYRHADTGGKVDRVSYGGFRGGFATANKSDDKTLYDHQAADSFRAFIRRYEGAAPFYREVGLVSTHGPWVTPRHFKGMYAPEAFRKPAAWADGFDKNDFIADQSPPNLDDDSPLYWEKSVRNYFSAMTFVDHHLGRIWKAIKKSPHADNTLVIITSDHGLHLGERGLFRKHTLWEQVANVPLIIHDPRRPDAQVVNDPVALVDIGPTIMDYLDLPAIPNSPGRSLRPLMNWDTVPDRAIPTFLEESAGIRKGKYRFIRYADGSSQLYDLSADWWQTRDLGPRHPAFAEMDAAHLRCCAEFGLDLRRAKTA